jgi:hypothetical protein
MYEAYFYDLRFGPTVLTFDGRVIEVFYDGYQARHHRYLATLGPLTGPDRKGAYEVRILRRADGHELYMISVDVNGHPQLAPFVAAVQAAG